MTTPLDTIRYHSGIAGEEVAELVDSLEQEVSYLREQVEKLTAERDAWKIDAIHGGNAAYLREELAALAEQNEKFRETLSRWRYQNLSYNWCCGNCGAVDGDGHKEGCALSLPDLATIILNKEEGE